MLGPRSIVLVLLFGLGCVESGRGDPVSAIPLEPLLVQVELHAQHEIGVLNGAVRDEEGHGGQGGEAIHLAHTDEKEGD